jgi:type IV pilus assembly protein PilA
MLGKMKKVLNNGKGFSLVELIVVIAILGILAGIAAPNVIRYIDSSRQRADLSTAAIIGNAAIAGVAEEEIAKSSFELLPTGATGTIATYVTESMQTGTLPTPKFNNELVYAVAVDANGGVTVGIVADDATAIGAEEQLFPNNTIGY